MPLRWLFLPSPTLSHPLSLHPTSPNLAIFSTSANHPQESGGNPEASDLVLTFLRSQDFTCRRPFCPPEANCSPRYDPQPSPSHTPHCGLLPQAPWTEVPPASSLSLLRSPSIPGASALVTTSRDPSLPWRAGPIGSEMQTMHTQGFGPNLGHLIVNEEASN